MGLVILRAFIIVAWLGASPSDLFEAVRTLAQTNIINEYGNALGSSEAVELTAATFCDAEY